jgi:hypothetical protein
MAATVTSVDGDQVCAMVIESGHGTSPGQTICRVSFDIDGWLGGNGWPVTYVWRLMPGTNPEPCDRTRFWELQ